MSSFVNTKTNQIGIPPVFRAVFRLWVVGFLLVVGLAGPLQAADQHVDEPLHRFQLRPGLSGLLDSTGGLVFRLDGLPTPVVTTELVSPADSRRRRGVDVFHAVVTDGIRGGQRGFSAGADDDGDGQVDEDPLDGIDNDLDGLVDEDFAAIGDAMVVIQLRERGGQRNGLHLEYYHWAAPRLSPLVFLEAGGGGESAGRGIYQINSPGPPWQETRITTLRHTALGRPRQNGVAAFVCQVPLDESSFAAEPCLPGAALWLGVMILDQDSPTRFLPGKDRLDLPLGGDPVPLVICAADSWLQLTRLLGEAQGLYRGMIDPVDKRHVNWIVPPTCSLCRASTSPVFDLKTVPNSGSGPEIILRADISPGQCGLLDPDLFRVGGRALGAPREIRWQPASGQGTSLEWGCMTADRLRDRDTADFSFFPAFAGLEDHQARGRLEFIFDPPFAVGPQDSDNDPDSDPDSGIIPDSDLEQDTATELFGRYLDGRPLRTTLTDRSTEKPAAVPVSAAEADQAPSTDPMGESVDEATRRYEKDRERILKSGRHPPSLSPDLLIGWPNPFSDVISIRFKVPDTMEDAFVWNKDQEQPSADDLAGEVPWSTGQPNVSVKIYNLNGQELVTLHSGSQGVGEYTVQWNGTDAFGRKVASGTYFCKLQMDDWSVTRRLVFIR